MKQFKARWDMFYIAAPIGLMILAAIDKWNIGGNDWKVSACAAVVLLAYGKLDSIQNGLEDMFSEE